MSEDYGAAARRLQLGSTLPPPPRRRRRNGGAAAPPAAAPPAAPRGQPGQGERGPRPGERRLSRFPHPTPAPQLRRRLPEGTTAAPPA